MTCREKLAQQNPKHINPNMYGGVDGCPHQFGYLPRPRDCFNGIPATNEKCEACWDREIPGTETINKKENEIMVHTKLTKAELIEEIKLAHEHIQEMENRIKNMERYKQYEAMADEMKAMHTAFVNSGFTNEQAYDLLKTMTQAVIPTALRGMGL